MSLPEMSLNLFDTWSIHHKNIVCISTFSYYIKDKILGVEIVYADSWTTIVFQSFSHLGSVTQARNWQNGFYSYSPFCQITWYLWVGRWLCLRLIPCLHPFSIALMIWVFFNTLLALSKCLTLLHRCQGKIISHAPWIDEKHTVCTSLNRSLNFFFLTRPENLSCVNSLRDLLLCSTTTEWIFITKFCESQPSRPEILTLKFSVNFTVALNPLQTPLVWKYKSAWPNWVSTN